MRRSARIPAAGWLAALFLAAIVGAPVVYVVGGGVAEAARHGRLVGDVTDPVTERALSNSIVQGGLAAMGAVALGAPAGLALGRRTFPGRELVRGLLLVPFLLPSLTMVIAVGAVFGPSGTLGGPWPAFRWFASGLPGVVTADVLYNAPIVAVLTALGVESADPALEESLRVLGASSLRVFRDSWGRGATLGAAAGAVLTFALSALAFAAPIALGGPAQFTLEARIWSMAEQLADPSGAAVVAAVGLAAFAPAAALYLVLVRRIRGPIGGRPRPTADRAGPGPRAAGFAAIAVLLGVEAVLLATVVAHLVGTAPRALGGGPLVPALFGPAIAGRVGLPLASAFANSLTYAAFAAAFALLLGLGLAVAGRGRSGAGLAGLPLATLLVSPVILALSLATVGEPLTGANGIWLLIVISQSLLALPFVAQSLAVALAQVPRSLGETGRCLGATPTGAFLDLELPAARAGIASAGLLAVALCLGEFTATYFLALPRFTTATVAIYDLASARLVPEAEALSALVVAVTGALLALASLGGRRVVL